MGTDPAVEAAIRATAPFGVSHFIGPGRHALRGAREALNPLRDRHKPKTSQRLAGVLVCAGCNIYWPCPDAKLIYPKDELKEQP